MKTKIALSSLTNSVTHKIQTSYGYAFIGCLLLSWFYAICSQIIIPLPFNLVPISLQPLPLLLLSLIIGWPAVSAWALYLIQGACGAPFFAGMLGGMARIVGPTGGYLFGFLFAAIFLASIRHYKKNAWIITLLKLEVANIILFACGIAQLSAFVPSHLLLSAGLYPFIIGDFFVKTAIILSCTSALRSFKK